MRHEKTGISVQPAGTRQKAGIFRHAVPYLMPVHLQEETGKSCRNAGTPEGVRA